MPYAHELVRRGTCISIQHAREKLAVFQGWYEGRTADESAQIDNLRADIGWQSVWQLGPSGVDEIIAGLFELEWRRRHGG